MSAGGALKGPRRAGLKRPKSVYTSLFWAGKINFAGIFGVLEVEKCVYLARNGLDSGWTIMHYKKSACGQKRLETRRNAHFCWAICPLSALILPTHARLPPPFLQLFGTK